MDQIDAAAPGVEVPSQDLPGRAQVEVPDRPPTPPATPEGGFNWPMLGVLLAVVGLIAVSNVWLRLRAEHQSLGELLRHWRRELWPGAGRDRD